MEKNPKIDLRAAAWPFRAAAVRTARIRSPGIRAAMRECAYWYVLRRPCFVPRRKRDNLVFLITISFGPFRVLMIFLARKYL